jgi:hypothetical protein
VKTVGQSFSRYGLVSYFDNAVVVRNSGMVYWPNSIKIHFLHLQYISAYIVLLSTGVPQRTQVQVQCTELLLLAMAVRSGHCTMVAQNQ